MFALKTLSQVLWGGNEPEEVAIIPAGELYLVRPTSVKGPRECMFKDAQLALVRSTLPHQYRLVVSRVYEEGEEELDSDVDTARDEHASATDADLRFYVSESEGRPTLVWSTATGDPEERFEFVVDTSQLGLDKAQTQTAQFEQAVQNCIYEGIYKQDAKTADPQLLRSLTNPPVSTPTLSSSTITHVIHAPESPSLHTTTDDFPTSLPSDNETDYEYLEEEEEEKEEFEEVNDDYSDDEPNEPVLPNILPDSFISVQPSDHLPGAFPSSDDVPRGAMNDYTGEEYESETDSDDLESLLSSEDDTAFPNQPDTVPDEGHGLILQCTAELYLFDPTSGKFICQAEECAVEIAREKDFRYWFWIHDDKHTFVTQPIDSDMNGVINQESLSFIWCYYDEQNFVYTWSVRFVDEATLDVLNQTYTQCLYETLHQRPYSNVNQADRAYLSQTNQEDLSLSEALQAKLSLMDSGYAPSSTDSTGISEFSSQDSALEKEDEIIDPGLAQADRGDHTLPEDEEETDEPSDESELDASDDESGIRTGDPRKHSSALGPQIGEQNSLLAVGYKHDRSFVVRGDKIGVFRHTEDNTIAFDTAINGIESATGATLNPDQVLLHQEDSSMIIRDKNDQHHLYRMDLEYGKVVEDWHIHHTIGVNHIAPSAKYAQTTSEPTLMGVSNNSLFRIDPRLAGSKLVEGELKVYQRADKFRCVTSTAKGYVAVGTDKGDIRLFNKLGSNAKMLLPSMGDTILGIDVTADGRFVLATCRNYLLLIDTLNSRDPLKRTGFERAIAVNDRTVPMKLQLDPKHVAFMGAPVAFTPAHFNTGEGSCERRIVTSTGPYVVTWNFRRVLQGKRYDYQIKKYAQNVVADNFRFGQDQAIVVALPQDVTMVTKRHLGEPQHVLKPPSLRHPPPTQSYNSIVNVPY